MTELPPDALAALPVFPLPRVVLMPHQHLPLHLFEPRYRAMIADCLVRGPRAIAVALLRPGWERDYQGRPPLHEVAGVGRIEDHHAHPDGTYDVLLVGVARVRLDELPEEGFPYRRARATLLADVLPSSGVPAADRAALLSTASTVAAAVRRRDPQFELGLDARMGPSELADVVANRLVPDAAERQSLLETVDVVARVRQTTQLVAELLARAVSRSPAASA